MIDTNCPKCNSNNVTIVNSGPIEEIYDDLVFYFFCYDCETEYEIICTPVEKSIVSELS